MESTLVPSSNWTADALGVRHPPSGAQARIVSLVPSITELLFDLRLGEQVVGRTGFCIHPASQVRAVPKVGGTKTVDVGKLRALRPTHVILNVDENTRTLYDELEGIVPHRVVTHPCSPQENAPLYRLMGGLFDRAQEAERLCSALADALGQASEATHGLPRERVLYLIWREPWMTVSGDTYVARMLALVGWDVLSIGGGDRYPELELSGARIDGLDRVLLSSEPYPFTARHREEVAKCLDMGNRETVMLVDGEMCSWYGSRAVRGLGYLTALRLGTR
jgi:ABC-type Fe3+-hydroxamate transport system substrate-binding protein